MVGEPEPHSMPAPPFPLIVLFMMVQEPTEQYMPPFRFPLMALLLTLGEPEPQCMPRQELPLIVLFVMVGELEEQYMPFPPIVLFMMVGEPEGQYMPFPPFCIVNPSIVDTFAVMTTSPLPPPSITATFVRHSLWSLEVSAPTNPPYTCANGASVTFSLYTPSATHISAPPFRRTSSIPSPIVR